MSETDEIARLQEERSAAGRQTKWDGEVLIGLLSTPNGRYWMERVLEFCRMNDAIHISTEDTLIGLGRRQVGLYLLDQIEQHTPDSYHRMIRERRARLTALEVKKVEADRRQRKLDSVTEFDDLTPLERMMDQQAAELAERKDG